MHLFNTSPHLKDNTLIITDEKLLHQLMHVLRIKPGDQMCVQETLGALTQRRTVTCTSCSKKEILTEIVDCQKRVKNESKICIAVAFPNKRDKAELIVQKLTEIGVDEITFFPAHRSILRDCPEKKLLRMQEIAREAVEQSWGWQLPEIVCKKSLSACQMPGVRLLIADGNQATSVPLQTLAQVNGDTLCIGPEGGFTTEETQLGVIVGLGNTVLRMETAAIVGAWVQVQKNLTSGRDKAC